MAFDLLKWILPDRPMPMRVWRGPFRGARLVMNPRRSLRKAFGLYEHELNAWLKQALPRVTRVLDVGANDGYFTLGCAAAFRRQGTQGEIYSFEPEDRYLDVLRTSVAAQRSADIHFEIIPALVGREVREGMTTLDALPVADRSHTLVKIDVEGAEIDVLAGGMSWLDRSNLFLIEVHAEPFLDQLRELFAQRGHKLLQIDQRPLPLLGREARGDKNWWLVSELR